MTKVKVDSYLKDLLTKVMVVLVHLRLLMVNFISWESSQKDMVTNGVPPSS